MTVETQKLELIDWILNLKDNSLLAEIARLKNAKIRTKTSRRKFGCGKGIFTYVSEDFDEPLEDFKEYM